MCPLCSSITYKKEKKQSTADSRKSGFNPSRQKQEPSRDDCRRHDLYNARILTFADAVCNHGHKVTPVS